MKKRIDNPDYDDALADFGENEACSPVDEVVFNPLCIEIARRFHKTPEQVSRDINRHYIASYKRPDGYSMDNLLDQVMDEQRRWKLRAKKEGR